MKKKTKIVATISDRNCDIAFIKELYENGMNVVRLNTAHQTHDDALKVINNVRKVSDKIAILLDTKGPEIRTNSMKEDKNVKRGDIVKFKGVKDKDSTDDIIYVSYEGFVTDIEIGSKILIDDGVLELKVIGSNNNILDCEVQNDGKIQGHKSVNIPSAYIKLPALTKKDMDFIYFAIEQKLDFIAHSFVRKPDDVIAVQSILDAMGSPIKIIAKIENQEGVDNIDSILEHVYGVMVARGDLAIEITEQRLPIVQRQLVEKCIAARKPVIVATQMLHTMIENPRPTRAEVNDVATAVYQGSDAVMLSGETAYGKFPVESVKMMSSICVEVEQITPKMITLENKVLTTHKASFMVKAAVEASCDLPITSIVADTYSGNTVLGIAAYRAKVPVYAQCYIPHIMRVLALSYGVECDLIKESETHSVFVDQALNNLAKRDGYGDRDLVAFVAGNYGKNAGASFLEVGRVDQLRRFVGNTK